MARFTLHRTAPASCASCASTSTRARRARTALRTRCMGERTSASRCPCGSQATSSVKTNTRAKKRSRSRVITRSRSDGKDGLYELLGVSPKSSQKEIKTAYRRLAKANHPDVGGDPEKFKSIAKAYAVLSTPGARKEYDRQQYRASNYSSYSSYTSSVEDTFDFFAKKAKEEDFYGLGDLFRDIEQEFSGMKDESSIFKKLGEDLLDFLEGSAYAPEEQKSGESGGTKASGGSQASQSSQSSQSSQRSQKRPEASSASSRRRPSSPAGTTSASFDAELELQELKRQMREGK